MQPGPVCTWTNDQHGHISCGPELSRYSRHGCPGDASKLPFILDLVGGTCLVEDMKPYNCIAFKRRQSVCRDTDSVCIPPHSEVMLWAKLKTNNGRRGPTAGVVLALQTFVQEFGLLVGRSLVRADAEDWKIPILNIQLRPVHNAARCLCVQSRHITSTYTDGASRGDPGDPTHWLSRD